MRSPHLVDALARAIDWLIERQAPDGWWTGELESNVTMTAEHVLMLRFLGVDLAPIRDGAVKHILAEQRGDGSWSQYFDGPADLSTTIEAYVALKVLGIDPRHDAMRNARRLILSLGGLVNARVFTKIWLALFGKYPWDGVPSLPPEIVFFPPWMPFNLYGFSCWARGTVAPLTLVVTRRPVRELGVDIDELIVDGTQKSMHCVTRNGFFGRLDRALKWYDRLPLQPFRARAMRETVKWIVERQEADGSWGGIQPPWVYSLMALHNEGFALDHAVMRRGLAGVNVFAIDDERGWRFQACMSPVWDTAWAVRALAAAGFRRSHPVMQRAIAWLLREQIAADQFGDWQVQCAGVPNGGWAFEFDNDIYPDIDDTAVVVLSLLEGGDRDAVAGAVARGVRWTLSMRSRNGAWAAFDRNNTSELVYKIPFADFGALTDPPSEDVTAHVLEMMGVLGYDETDEHVASGLKYLRKMQRPNGSWFGRWGVNYVYGTWCVISALYALRTGDDMIARGADWLERTQNDDGGWGETCHSYVDESFAAVGASTASQTAWAVIALQLAGRGKSEAAQRGLRYLAAAQRPDGTWDEPHFTGTGFPGYFYINYHLYRHLFPLMALAMDSSTPATISFDVPTEQQEYLTPS